MAPVIIVLVAIIVFLLIGGWLVGLAFSLLWFVIVGLLIGALARAILPGRQAIGWLGTMGAGLAGSLLGAILADLFDAGGLVQILVAIASAAILIAVFSGAERATA
jgi:uncharacterized membrane protein YeaQ/YmgE (transglycosylase-associated protein family)